MIGNNDKQQLVQVLDDVVEILDDKDISGSVNYVLKRLTERVLVCVEEYWKKKTEMVCQTYKNLGGNPYTQAMTNQERIALIDAIFRN